MKKLHYHIFVKAGAFILHQICYVITAVTLLIGITYWNYDDATFNIIEQEDFTRTNYYKRLVEEHIYDLITYIGYCEKFQTEGINDSGRIVDIYDYIENDRITGEVTYSLGYRIRDLLAWEKDGFTYTDTPAPVEGEMGSSQQLVETYQNTSGFTLAAYAQAAQLDYSEVCEMLERAAEKLATEYADYRTMTPNFKKTSTNLRYAIYHLDDGQLYTNMNVSNIADGLQQIKEFETYITLNSTTSDFDSSILYTNDQLSHYLNALYSNSQNHILAIGVDTQFPVLDSFHKEKLRYHTFERWFDTLYKMFVISIIGYVLTFILLTAWAGHKKGHSGICHPSIDKLPTELLLLMAGLGELLVWQGIKREMNGFFLPSINPATIVKLALLSLAASLLFTICYLSFLRRLKSQTLWSDSLLATLSQWCRQLFCSRHLTLIAVVYYLALLTVTVLCILYTKNPFISLGFTGILAVGGFFFLRDQLQKRLLFDGLCKIANGDLAFQIDTERLSGTNKRLGESINQIRNTLHDAVEDSLKNERLKTSLITNVSHDIKTPLTSIINYVALLQNIPLENETAKHYIQILDDKSQRLKHLTEDLVEASKISSHNIVLEKTLLNLNELITQTSGEFYERFEEKQLTLVTLLPEEAVPIEADGRRIWRILENIYTNALKYSQEHTRIYARLETDQEHAVFSLKNVSAQPLTVETSELTKRFIRGDAARTTEGSGLGLSIAKDLTLLHGGTFDITTDGDLFSVIITLPLFHPVSDETTAPPAGQE